MRHSEEGKSRLSSLRTSKLLRWMVGIPVALVLLLAAASYLFDEPLRRFMEERINRNLKGYSVQLSAAHLQLLDLSLTLKGLTLIQQAHPIPAVASFPVITATIHWREIFFGKLVAEVRLNRPSMNINLQQLSSEAASTVSLKERGWQQALEEIYPLKINTVTVTDANVTYIDQDPQRPLVLSRFNLRATNIRNIHQPDQVYPSPFKLDTAIFESGYGTVEGNANFLARPHVGMKGRFTLEKVPIDYFKTVAARSNLSIDGGVLKGTGNAEYAATVKIARLENLTIQGMKLDYIHSQRTAGAEKARAVVVGNAAKKLANKPGLLIRADQVTLTGCTLGLVNQAAKKPYRIFLAGTDLQLSNFSNQFEQGPAHVSLKAKFMGSGITTASATFRPENRGPDLDLSVNIGETQLTSMNNLLRSYGDFDVSAGVFSFVTELHVKNGAISGYIKPFFKGMDVYDRRTDSKNGVGHQMYEMMIGGVAKILENRPRQQVATRADISGPVGNPEASGWQIALELIKNAFFKAILPGFEKEASGEVKR
ncbi:MAG: DUF748 domain-containing protein [Desulfuromonadaceae bacterium]|nr:DUF748 domain-containing protein [Desulfuromonadaceae bacterium]